MTDRQILAWIASHQLIAYTVLLVVIGTLAGLVRERTPEERAAFEARSPTLASIAKFLQTYGIDARKLVGIMVSIVVTKLGGSAGRSMRPPPDAPPPSVPPPPLGAPPPEDTKA